ncbi:hypothetical protein A9B99_12060 [Mangrovibacter phragmitis]|uniref:Uncharacterized protein n=1 Tax=Mangrovibacter phragmitis TaxID=1691903 RepID=A0A1B7L196_9ENTR|nr:hypothetical protein A9B99_12060 [Mangrovibacter phragmitis]
MPARPVHFAEAAITRNTTECINMKTSVWLVQARYNDVFGSTGCPPLCHGGIPVQRELALAA